MSRPRPDPLAHGLGGEERIEDAGLNIGRNAWTIVRDLNDHDATLSAVAQMFTSSPASTASTAFSIRLDQAHQFRIGGDHGGLWQAQRGLELYGRTFLAGLRPQHFHRFSETLGNVRRLRVRRLLSIQVREVAHGRHHIVDVRSA